jgi:hypothetical protein
MKTFRRLALAVFLALLVTPAAPAALRGSKPDRFPRSDDPPRPGLESPAAPKRQRIFGIGVGFEVGGTLAGVALKLVLPDSPAFRAGLISGCIVAEINGQPTAGRTGDECARIIREGGNTVQMKVLDPTMRERTIQLEKQWLAVPE